MKIIGPRTKCGQDIKIDLGGITREEAAEKVKALGAFTCPGFNAELCSYPCSWNSADWKIEDGEIPIAEEQEASMRYYVNS